MCFLKSCSCYEIQWVTSFFMESALAFQLYVDFSGQTQATGLVQQTIVHAEPSHELLLDLLLLLSCGEELRHKVGIFPS